MNLEDVNNGKNRKIHLMSHLNHFVIESYAISILGVEFFFFFF